MLCWHARPITVQMIDVVLCQVVLQCMQLSVCSQVTTCCSLTHNTGDLPIDQGQCTWSAYDKLCQMQVAMFSIPQQFALESLYLLSLGFQIGRWSHWLWWPACACKQPSVSGMHWVMMSTTCSDWLLLHVQSMCTHCHNMHVKTVKGHSYHAEVKEEGKRHCHPSAKSHAPLQCPCTAWQQLHTLLQCAQA